MARKLQWTLLLSCEGVKFIDDEAIASWGFNLTSTQNGVSDI